MYVVPLGCTEIPFASLHHYGYVKADAVHVGTVCLLALPHVSAVFGGAFRCPLHCTLL